MASGVPTLDELVAQVGAYVPNLQPGLIQRAYEWSRDSHEGQVRKTGEPYFNHCVATAAILAGLRMEPEVIAAGLLHDAIEDTHLTLDELKAAFGDEVASLVNGVTKLSQIADVTGHRKRDVGQQEAESLRKLFLAMGDDVRVVPIKLADRLHNMRTLHGHSREKQVRIARETLDIFAPLANRLGIWQLKWELEDLCLRYLEPEIYASLVEGLNEQRNEREELVAEVVATLRKRLADEGLVADISGRSKHLYSIYKKMQRKDSPLDKIFDVRAVRIIVEQERDCYIVLGVVHRLWHPIPNEFDDYIANPKPNGYQSLHTAVFGPRGRSIEVQIRDQEMHLEAEYGVCAHWRYKEQRKERGDQYLDEKVRVIRQLLEWHSEDETVRNDASLFVEQMKEELRPGNVFVFTPKGEVRELPAGATPIDFAYYIHTDVGHSCSGARVNGAMVPLDYTLKNGDQVEIVVSKSRKGPSRDWISPYSDFVKTPRARSKIKAWFRHQGREEKIRQGRDSLEREMQRLSVKEKFEALADHHHFERVEDFFAAIGAGDLSPHGVATALLDRQRRAREKPEPRSIESDLAQQKTTAPTNGRRAADRSNAVSLDGMSGMLIRFAGCCNPVSGDAIVGYITRGQGITVHREDCSQVRNRLDEEERFLSLDWNSRPDDTFNAPIKIMAFDREGLVRDITEVVSNERINMVQVNATTNEIANTAVITLTLGVQNVEQISRVIARLRTLQNVIEVHRASS